LTASEYDLGSCRELIAEINAENLGEYVIAKVSFIDEEKDSVS